MTATIRRWRFVRWVLPLLSPIPVVLGIVEMVTVKGPGDAHMAAAMSLAFIFLPVSFVLALVAGLAAVANWKTWPKLDRAIGVGPLLLLTAAVVICILLAVLGH